MIKIDIVDDIMWDHLSVFKLTRYPLNQGPLKPFAQAQLCYHFKRGLMVKLWAFEINPINRVNSYNDEAIFKDSVLSVVLGKKDELNRLIITFNKQGSIYIKTANQKFVMNEKDNLIKLHLFEGEDLQGVYWGGSFLIPERMLERYLDFKEKENQGLKINFIKSCFDKDYYHCGGYLLVDEDWGSNLEEINFER